MYARGVAAANILIALGSNRRHGRYGAPAGVVAAAMLALDDAGLEVVRRSRIRATAPLGPGGRSFANAVVLARGDLPPNDVIASLKRIEAQFGRRGGKRWGDRVLDLDLLAINGQVLPSRLRWRLAQRGAIVPHKRLHQRDFVLDPLVDVAPAWRHPVLGATARQLRARLQRRKRGLGSP